MPHLSLLRLTQSGCALLLSGLLACAQAVELGETVVRSYAGQPLVADIELTAFAADAAAVQARLASPEVYRGANIAIHPVLSTLRMSVMRRDGRQYLHITSIQPVDADFIHLFLELTEGSRRNVRGTTLWFSADPDPAPPPVPPMPMPLPAPAARAAKAAPLRQAPAAPAACPQPFSAAQVKTCAVLDEKNAVLTAQIAELEAKVRLLQVAIEGRPAALPAPLSAPAPAAMRAAAPAVGAAQGDPAGGAIAWLWIGIAGTVAAVGAVAVVLRRRRQSRPSPEMAARPGFVAGVKQRLMQARAGR